MEIFQRYSKNFMPTKSYYSTLCLLYFKNTNFRTHEPSASFEISYRDAINIKKKLYSKYCDKADKGDKKTFPLCDKYDKLLSYRNYRLYRQVGTKLWFLFC